MPLVDKRLIKKILDDFNAQGKTLEQVEMEIEQDRQVKMLKLAADPKMKAIWAEAEEDAQEKMRKVADD